MSPSPGRACTACGRSKSTDPEMFLVVGHRKDGTVTLHTKCKPCIRAYNTAWRIEKLKGLADAPCSERGCENSRYVAKGLCRPHYDKARRRIVKRICSVSGCDKRHESRGFCSTHVSRFQRYGEPGGAEPRRRADGEGTFAQGYLRFRKNGRVISEHRVVMEEMLGRDLLPTENVHHRNGDRADNRPSNLELWTTSQPSGQRVEDKIAWAKEFLAFYEGTLSEPELSPAT